MNYQKAEKERKYYNRKLLIKSFQSEWKKKKKVDIKRFIVECIELMSAYFIANWLVEKLSIRFWFFEFILLFVSYMILRYVIEFIIQAIRKKE